MKPNFPQIPIFTGWAAARQMLKDEFQQCLEEGREREAIERLRAKAEALDESEHEQLTAIWHELQKIPQRVDFPFFEPSDLEEIRRERCGDSRQLPHGLNDEALYDRMVGAWLGRSAGCALGKPVELFMTPHNGLTSRERIKRYLTAISPAEYPIVNYIPEKSPASDITGKVICKPSTRESIAFMETDDDIRYTVLGQIILAEKGADFTTLDVAFAWLRYLGYFQVCTAETQSYRNLVIRYPRREDMTVDDWDWVATNHNPYREWIGAQIRADSWGYAAPGNPSLAAEFAWRDARMSHVKNGIYGEMLCAAMIAAGFSIKDPLAVVEAGLAEIPARSRLHKDILDTVAICNKHGNRASEFEAVLDNLYARLGHYSPVHTNNNAALVVASLLLGGDDFEKAIGISVMGGWDTDCNGATVGSIWGAMHGASRIPKKWASPLNDKLYSFIPDYHPIAISECARRSVEIAKRISGE